MPENEKINISVEPGVKTLEIIERQGKAPNINEPKPVAVTGEIEAPKIWFNKRKDIISPDKCHVLINRQEGTIVLFEDPSDALKPVITGTLKLNPFLAEFDINGGKSFSLKNLVQFLRVRRGFFADKEEHGELIEGLIKFNYKAQTEVEKANDNKGNIRLLFEKNIKEKSVKDEFVLCMPIFVGDYETTFKVDIKFDFRDTTEEFWFESNELAELLISRRNEMIDAVVVDLDPIFPVIEVG